MKRIKLLLKYNFNMLYWIVWDYSFSRYMSIYVYMYIHEQLLILYIKEMSKIKHSFLITYKCRHIYTLIKNYGLFSTWKVSTASYFSVKKLFYLSNAVDNVPVFNNFKLLFYSKSTLPFHWIVQQISINWPLSTWSTLMWMLSLPFKYLLNEHSSSLYREDGASSHNDYSLVKEMTVTLSTPAFVLWCMNSERQ